MNKSLIKLAYKQVIDTASTGIFEKKVFNDTYREFLMQAQAYNPENKYNSFQELLTHVPKSVSLHYKVGFAIGLYVNELNHQIPGLKDSLGRINLPFDRHEFEIIDSAIINKSEHKVAITYFTGSLTLLACIGEFMLLSLGDQSKVVHEAPIETFLLQISPNLSIASYIELEKQTLLESR